MRRGVGAIFTTGVALVGATVVVANPVSAPPSDVRVAPVKLSSDSTASNAALDQALLDALAKDPAETSPVALFKKSVAGVVTNVTFLSGRALRVQPVVDGTPAPVPPAPPPSAAVVDLLGGKPANIVATEAPPAAMGNPALQHAVSSVADYVGYVSVQAVEATDAAGAITGATPKHIADTLAQLTHGDVNSAITTALRTAAAPVGPPSAVVSAIRTEVRKRLSELADRLSRSLPPPPRIGKVTRPSTVERSTSLRATLGHRRGATLTTKPAADQTDEADQTEPDQKKPTAVNGATDLTDGNKAVPNKKAPHTQLRQRAEASLNQARTSLERLGDALRKAVPAPKLPKLPRPHRAHRP
ncbi:hypothetical protein FHT40_005564 [Mycolicibacterium sp. BK556]|uniref:hypothetical protein n=1 Tax=unclassified Mycolicibacterium TaxID=2636767 RepID=UPI00160B1317|nr:MULTISPECIES: hypothetical protein [unclassified Mycolicibacterium]MBB3605877.1 hypothetical protein [Mycolicibacterium sp. BK556]MBB3635626.1 hypothetical protein [Mycolicibacterium sp. BK607]